MDTKHASNVDAISTASLNEKDALSVASADEEDAASVTTSAIKDAKNYDKVSLFACPDMNPVMDVFQELDAVMCALSLECRGPCHVCCWLICYL
jgi:hypothetical protein